MVGLMLKTLSTGQVLLRNEDDLLEWFKAKYIARYHQKEPEAYPCFAITVPVDWGCQEEGPEYWYPAQVAEQVAALKEAG